LAKGEGAITKDEEFAFVAGQVIYYILSKSVSEDRSYSKLLPFLQQTEVEQFLQQVKRIFNTYAHADYPKKFSHPFAEVTGYSSNPAANSPKINLQKLMPLILSGYFSDNEFYKANSSEA
jgi:CRISPR-associated protein Csh1